ncbi:MAG: hypothetical protein AB202_00720 [Parcubacteria bacterium C7867-007]|nr:MAG: hypothetical protein AB202_00720 [Parcubacteria bacterium C7867-007]
MGLFGSKTRSTQIMIDVGSSSVGGAYVCYESGQLPIIYYSTRINMEPRPNETHEDLMLRTLEEVTNRLVKKGAPEVRREVGNAHADGTLVSIAAPWQETRVRTETIQSVRPFVFTKKLLNDTVRKSANVQEGWVDSGDSVIATILNGYEIPNPFGKSVKRAELVVLSSTLQKEVMESIERVMRKAFHSHDVTFTGFAPVWYRIFREMYQHENDYLILDIRGARSDLAFIQRGLLRDVGSIPHGTRALLSIGQAASDLIPTTVIPQGSGLGASYLNRNRNVQFGARVQEAEEEWIECLATLLKEFAGRQALPRTMFLLADDDVRGFLVRALDTPAIHTMWLSDEPLRIVPITPAQFTPYVRTFGTNVADIFIDLLALYHTKSTPTVENEPEILPPPVKLTKEQRKALKEQEKEAAKAARPTMGDMVSSAAVGVEGEPDFSM